MIPVAVIGQAISAVAGFVKNKGQQSAALTGKLADNLAARADWLIGLVFLVWAGPVIHAYVNPDMAGRLAAVLAELPTWYVEGFTEISYGAAGAAAIMRMVKR